MPKMLVTTCDGGHKVALSVQQLHEIDGMDPLAWACREFDVADPRGEDDPPARLRDNTARLIMLEEVVKSIVWMIDSEVLPNTQAALEALGLEPATGENDESAGRHADVRHEAAVQGDRDEGHGARGDSGDPGDG